MNTEDVLLPQKLYLAPGEILKFFANKKEFVGRIVGEATSPVLDRVGVHLDVGAMVPKGAKLTLPDRTGGCGDAHPYLKRGGYGLDIVIAHADVDPTSPIKG